MGNLASHLCHGGSEGSTYPGGWIIGSSATAPADGQLPLHEQFRHSARQEELQRQAASQASQAAYHRNDHTGAAAYSKQAKAHAAERDRWNEKAALAYFALANPMYNMTESTTLQVCDLHGLTIAEAIQKAKEHVRACRRLHLKETVLITGKGLHSQNGRARLKPALEQFCREESIGATIDPRNEGRITLSLEPAATSSGSHWWLQWLGDKSRRDDACLIM